MTRLEKWTIHLTENLRRRTLGLQGLSQVEVGGQGTEVLVKGTKVISHLYYEVPIIGLREEEGSELPMFLASLLDAGE